MSSRASGALGIAAWGLSLLLLMGNLGYFSTLLLSERQVSDIWSGPLMPGKRYLLPENTVGRGVKAPVAEALVEDVPVVKEPPPVAKVLEPLPKEEGRPPPVNKVGGDVSGVGESNGYVVQVGSSVLDLGVEGLLASLREKGFDPKTQTREEGVRLNVVQAGPFRSLEEAKVVETVLKSSGYGVGVEGTSQGYVISLGKRLMLGLAVKDMEDAVKLGIKPLRMVKVDDKRAIVRVYLGPFTTKENAQRMSDRVEQLGLAVPRIEAWEPDGVGEGKRDK